MRIYTIKYGILFSALVSGSSCEVPSRFQGYGGPPKPIKSALMKYSAADIESVTLSGMNVEQASGLAGTPTSELIVRDRSLIETLYQGFFDADQGYGGGSESIVFKIRGGMKIDFSGGMTLVQSHGLGAETAVQKVLAETYKAKK